MASDSKLGNKYISFGALLAICGTGIAVVAIGAILLSWNAYLSTWMPAWTWSVLGGFTFLGVAITATSTAAAIATVAPKPAAAHKCLVLMLMFLGLEVSITSYSVYNQPEWTASLYLGIRKTMYDTLSNFSTNETSQQMWNEIQQEMECCGVESYKDWFSSVYGDGSSVPDSCCYIMSADCGKGAKSFFVPGDTIATTGCLSTIANGWKHTYDVISKQALFPICVIQILMVLIIVLSFRAGGYLDGHLPSIRRRASLPTDKKLLV